MDNCFEIYKNSIRALEKRNIELNELHLKHSRRWVNKSKLKKYLHLLRTVKYRKTIKFRETENQNIDEREYSLIYSKPIKLVVYTAIIGNYDDLLEPLFQHPNIDFVAFTDKKKQTSNWQVKEIPESIKYSDSTLINRYLKFHPHEFFQEYDYSIYIDGNINVCSDVTGLINNLSEYGIAMHKHFERDCLYDEARALKIIRKGKKNHINCQINKYYKEGMPKNYGLAEATIILTDLSNNFAKTILNQWWTEFYESKSLRDQLSFPYIAWKNHVDLNKVTTLGRNLRLSSKFNMINHL